MQNNSYLYALTILAFDDGTEIILCYDCFRETFGHYENRERKEFSTKNADGKEGKPHFCSLCRKRIIVNRRSGATRRVTNYNFHLPERRKRTKRVTDIIAWQRLNVTQKP